MIPLKDYNPTSRPAVVTMGLIGLCVVIYLLVQPHRTQVDDAEFSFKHAAIPCEVTHGRPLSDEEVTETQSGEGSDQACSATSPASVPRFPDKPIYLAILYSMFLHGGLLHIAGNMLFLWVFGNNIEDVMGPVGYLGFYLVAGLVAAAAHIAVQPASSVPIVGASGAIAGVMGAYLVLYPNVKIRSVVIFYFLLIRDISAKWLLGFWFVTQFFTSPSSGVAWMAHVGGFVFGAVVGLLLRDRLRPKRVDWAPEQQGR